MFALMIAAAIHGNSVERHYWAQDGMCPVPWSALYRLGNSSHVSAKDVRIGNRFSACICGPYGDNSFDPVPTVPGHRGVYLAWPTCDGDWNGRSYKGER